MMNRANTLFIIFHIVFAALAFTVNAQDTDSIQTLDPAIVSAKLKVGTSQTSRFNVGISSIVSDSATIARLSHSNLNSYISLHTPAYVRESGIGSTISLRGTAASHTSVSWNGVSLAPTTMGQLNLSHVPMFFLDEVSLNLGGGSALYGSGAIGGNLQLNTGAAWDDRRSVMLQQIVGSFGHSFSGVKVGFGGERWKSKTSALYSQATNDFPYKKKTEGGVATYKQNNAAYRNGGFQQELYFKLSPRTTLSSQTRFMAFYNEMQPTINMPENTNSIKGRNLYTILNLGHNANSLQINFTGAYLYDHEKFSDFAKKREDIIATQRFVGIIEAEKLLLKVLRVKVGANSDYIVPDVDAYQSGTREWRNDVYALLLFTHHDHFEASANFRQAFVTKLNVPFALSLNLSYKLMQNASQELKTLGSFSRNIKIPSLNDRYWGDVLNEQQPSEGDDLKGLKPESGTNIEAGVSYSIRHNQLTFNSNFTFYHNNVDNWILWTPRGPVWKPENIQQVNATGLEAVLGGGVKLHQLTIRTGLTYAFTKSTVRKLESKDDPRIGKQLTFQPKHRLTANIDMGYKSWLLCANYSYVGLRYGTDSNAELSPYGLINLMLEKRILLKKHQLLLSAQVNNLLNTEYQTMYFFAMPGRNFKIGIQYFFK